MSKKRPEDTDFTDFTDYNAIISDLDKTKISVLKITGLWDSAGYPSPYISFNPCPVATATTVPSGFLFNIPA